jgi:(1->4)-alpha-D-glucan 1-alpha-D-glucosylmutase
VAEAAFTALWRDMSGDDRGFAEVALTAKREQADSTFQPELARLMSVQDVAGGVRALADAVASFPVYRTYVVANEQIVAPEDRDAVARVDAPAELAEMLLLERPVAPEFVTRFQQTTPAVVAKGVEDTAFYRYARLLALCDVGGDPGRFGIGVDRFHAGNAERADRFPEGMLTTTTHDTKRSADVRARIAALTWLPDAWAQLVGRWMALTEPLRSGGAPDDAERYFILQTLVGAWPIERERMEEYLTKALREAKCNTSWTDVNADWENAVQRFCAAVYDHSELMSALDDFTRGLEFAGDRISLGMVALKLTAPGIPDIYQGDELPLRALVDPDNRRPIDWEWRSAMLGRLAGGARVGGAGFETRKLWLTTRLLGLRIRRPHAFAGAYEPLDAGEATVAFRRGGEVVVAVATRPGAPGGTLRGAQGTWRDVLSAEERVLAPSVPLSELLDEYGLVVLERL